jgi:hypothetical protein
MEKLVSLIYRSYLANLAKKENRPFRIPKDIMGSLEKRNDYRLFYGVSKRFIEDKIQVDRFMSCAYDHLSNNFYIAEILNEYKIIKQIYDSYTIGSDKEKKIKEIKKAFQFLEEYCIMKGVKDGNELLKGNPPLILKFWKEKKINSITLISLFDINTIRKKSWSKLYAGQLISNYGVLSKQIDECELIQEALRNGFVKLSKVLSNLKLNR